MHGVRSMCSSSTYQERLRERCTVPLAAINRHASIAFSTSLSATTMSSGFDIDYLTVNEHDVNNLPPEPCAENPGRVYPRFDPRKAASRTPSSDYARSPRYVGNPYLMHGAFKKLDHSLGELISILEGEEASSLLDEENPLLQKFRGWREELDQIRATDGRSPASTSLAQLATPSRSRSPVNGRGRSPAHDGGLFVD